MAESTRLSCFQQLLLNSVLDEYAALPEEQRPDSAFSPGFLLKMEKLIRKTHSKTWYYINSTAKKVILIAIILGLLTITALAVPAIREAIIDFFLHEHEERYGITFDPEEAANAPGKIEIIYSPSFLPAGFSLQSQETASNQVTSLWADSSGNYLAFDQCIIPRNATADHWIGIDASGTMVETAILCEYQVTMISSESHTILIWTDHDYLFSLQIPDSVPRHSWEAIISSLKPI